MINATLKWSFRITFVMFVVALVFSVVLGLYLLWNPAEITEDMARTIATGLIFVFASLFYTAVCDAWFRINGDAAKKRNSEIK